MKSTDDDIVKGATRTIANVSYMDQSNQILVLASGADYSLVRILKDNILFSQETISGTVLYNLIIYSWMILTTYY